MPKGADFTCPDCGKKNFVSFAQVKKNLKGSIRIALSCGCNLPPQKIVEELAKIARAELRKINPKLSE